MVLYSTARQAHCRLASKQQTMYNQKLLFNTAGQCLTRGHAPCSGPGGSSLECRLGTEACESQVHAMATLKPPFDTGNQATLAAGC